MYLYMTTTYKPEEIYGVALILLNSEGKIYCIEELLSKPEIGRKKGDYSFPMETRFPEETESAAMTRLILEEIDATGELQITEPVLLGDVMVHGVRARVYTALFMNGKEDMRGLHAGIEIRPSGWRTEEELLACCRDGVSDMLKVLRAYQNEAKAERG